MLTSGLLHMQIHIHANMTVHADTSKHILEWEEREGGGGRGEEEEGESLVTLAPWSLCQFPVVLAPNRSTWWNELSFTPPFPLSTWESVPAVPLQGAAFAIL